MHVVIARGLCVGLNYSIIKHDSLAREVLDQLNNIHWEHTCFDRKNQFPAQRGR
jgi:hypothetical protein